MYRSCKLVGIIVLILVDVGCKDATPSTEVRIKPMIVDLKELLQEFEEKHKRAPKNLSELDAMEPSHPGSCRGLMLNLLVYAWGVPLTPGSSAILAFDATAPEKGGWVLLQDGTVKEMSASEFQSAPRAKK
jgi:hypothetical protein